MKRLILLLGFFSAFMAVLSLTKASAATLGYANIGAYSACNGASYNSIYGNLYVAPQNGTVVSLSAYVGTLSPGNWNLTLGIYNVLSGIPTTLLGQGSMVANPDSWNTVDLVGSSTVNLVAGQQYFIGMVSAENNGVVNWCTVVYTPTTADQYQAYYSYNDYLPSAFPGGGCGCDDVYYSLYANYLPSSPAISDQDLIGVVFYGITIVFAFGLVFGIFRRALRWILPKRKE